MEEQFENEHTASASPSEEEQLAEEAAKSGFNLGKEIFEWVYTIAIALVIAFVIKGFIFDVVKVDGRSMYPTLHDNDRLIVTKLGYKPQQGDIIVLDSTYKNRTAYYNSLEASTGEDYNWFKKLANYHNLPKSLKKKYYVKRIIALPGQTINIVNGKVLVDGEELKEPYYDGVTTITDPTVTYPLTVEEGMVFVMGDNRPDSQDSRSAALGQVPIDAIMGKSQLRILPLSSFGLTK